LLPSTSFQTTPTSVEIHQVSLQLLKLSIKCPDMEVDNEKSTIQAKQRYQLQQQ
jgi:hypothetical protein